MIRVLLADDHRMVREGLAAVLAREPDIEVVAYASDGAEAIALAQIWKPDVVLLDVCMPGTNGIQAAARIRKLLPRTRILALSAVGERPFVAQMIEAGAVGFVLKEQSVGELADAVRTLVAGGRILPDWAQPSAQPSIRLLSQRETQVLDLLATGRGARQIAEAMTISTKTVDTYRRRIMAKLGIQSQAALLRYAVALWGGGPEIPAAPPQGVGQGRSEHADAGA